MSDVVGPVNAVVGIVNLSSFDIMGGFGMTSKVNFLLECFVTEVTCKRFHSSMLSHMGNQI